MHRRVAVVAVLAVLAVGLAAGAPMATGTTMAAGDQPTPASPAVADGLSTAGTTTVVVQLPDHTPRIESPSKRAATTSGVNRTPTRTISTMESHAAATRQPLERFADGNPHVSIDRRLWLANAVVLTVDTDRVPLARIAGVDNVEQIHENYRVSINTTTTAPPAAAPQPNTATGSTTTATRSPQDSPTADAPTTTTANITTTTTNTRFTRALELIRVPQAWQQFNTRGEGVRVAVLDTGVNPNHPDIEISDENWACYDDCLTEGPHDVDGHGTHVSGTVVGGDANDAGLQIGVAPEATLMHAKVLNNTGGGTYGGIVEGMQWAVQNDADVISASLGGDGYNDAFIDPVRNAQESGTIVVASIGNSGSGTSGSPANVYDSTAVGSVDVQPGYPERWNPDLTDDTVSEFSGGEIIDSADWEETYNNTPNDWPDSYVVPDVTAPGNIIWSADTDTETTTCGGAETTDLTCLSGTSMATPHVSGTVALMLSTTNNTLSPAEVNTTLETTTVDIGAAETRQGAGRINATAAVAAVASGQNFAVDITTAPTAATAGRQLSVEYTVENTGTEAGAQPIVLRLDETAINATTTQTLEPDESVSGRFTYQTTSTDVGTRTLTVESDDNSASRTIDIVAPTVKLTNTSLKPDTITSGSTNDYTLTTDVYNISDDGQPETVTITLPATLTLTETVEATDVTAVDTDGELIDVAIDGSNDSTITLSMSPDPNAELRDLTLTADFSAEATSPAN